MCSLGPKSCMLLIAALIIPWTHSFLSLVWVFCHALFLQNITVPHYLFYNVLHCTEGPENFTSFVVELNRFGCFIQTLWNHHNWTKFDKATNYFVTNMCVFIELYYITFKECICVFRGDTRYSIYQITWLNDNNYDKWQWQRVLLLYEITTL